MMTYTNDHESGRVQYYPAQLNQLHLVLASLCRHASGEQSHLRACACRFALPSYHKKRKGIMMLKKRLLFFS